MRLALVDNVLLDPATRGESVELQPHLGLLALVASLRRAGRDAVLYDPKLDIASGTTRVAPGFADATAARIAALRPDVVGFTTLGCNFATTIGIVRALRRRAPATPIVLGGPHASILDREILARFAPVDAIVRGEADETIVDVAAAFAGELAFERVAGLTYRRAGEIVRTDGPGPIRDLDALPFPAYDAYPIGELGLDSLRVDAGRGCPFGCTFCSTATFFGRLYRLKSTARLVDELDRLAATYGVRSFTLNHDLFTVDAKRVRAFCEAVEDRGYRWSCSARLDCVDDELLGAMARAGCSGIYYGIETGSRRLQRVVEKRLDLDLYHPRIARTLALGIGATASFIIGYPQEDEADQADTLALIAESIDRYDGALDVQLHLLAPEPGTGLHARFAETLAYDGYVSDFVIPPIEHDESLAAAADPEIFVCQHYFAAGVARHVSRATYDAFRILSAYDRAIVRTLVRRIGSLAGVLQGIAAATCDGATTDVRAVASFCDARFGDDDVLSDVVRFALEAGALRADARGRANVASGDGPIALATSMRPLGPICDARRAIASLARGEIGPHRSSRVPRLLVGKASTAYRAFEIDETTLELARSLQRPTTRAALVRRFAPTDVEPRLAMLALLGGVVSADGATSAGR